MSGAPEVRLFDVTGGVLEIIKVAEWGYEAYMAPMSTILAKTRSKLLRKAFALLGNLFDGVYPENTYITVIRHDPLPGPGGINSNWTAFIICTNFEPPGDVTTLSALAAACAHLALLLSRGDEMSASVRLLDTACEWLVIELEHPIPPLIAIVRRYGKPLKPEA